MSETAFRSDLEELKALAAVGDYSRFTRRTLDFVYEYGLPAEFWAGSNRMRMLYYRASELEASHRTGNEYRELIEAGASFLAKAAEIPSSILPPSATLDTSPPVYQSTGLSKTFQTGGTLFWLQPIDVKLFYGEITGVVGENGNGKTTLLRMVGGELMPDSGHAEYFPGENISPGMWYRIKAKTVFMPQRLERCYGPLYENLIFFGITRGISPHQIIQYVEYALHRLGLMPFRHHSWSQISSGYRLRFELAKMLLLRPRILILDEPLANLDINAQQLLLEDLRFIARSRHHPISILISSQQLHEVERVADRLIFLRKGKVLFNDERSVFGTGRERNSFELEGNFSRAELEQVLAEIGGCSTEDTGTVLIVNAPVEVSAEILLARVINNGKQVRYFRDISTSSRKLFQKEF